MDRTTVACDGKRPDGATCGAAAVVHQTHYEYDRMSYSRSGGFGPKLIEVRYEIECPNCGRRTQIEKA